jgi:chitosanase
MELTPSQKLLCERIINVFETSSIHGDYGNISIFRDGPGRIRQITFGRSQTTEYGNLRELVSMYVEAGGVYSERLRPFVSLIGRQALVNNVAFKDLLKRAGRGDPIMETTQDAFFDKRYFQPALKWAQDHGFSRALSVLVIYDSFIHSGGILDLLRARFSERPPSKGGREEVWIRQYVEARNDWLRTHSNRILRPTVYRTQCFLREIKRENWDLAQLPIVAHGVSVDDKPLAQSSSAPVAFLSDYADASLFSSIIFKIKEIAMFWQAVLINLIPNLASKVINMASDAFATETAPAPAKAEAKVETRAATAGVNLSKTTVATGLAGTIFGTVIAIASPFLIALDPSAQHVISGVFTGLAGLGAVIASVWQLFHLNATTSDNTLSMINSATEAAKQLADIVSKPGAQPSDPTHAASA